MPLTFLSEYPLTVTVAQKTVSLCHDFEWSVHVNPVSHFLVIIHLILLPDIPLSSLEESKSEHIRLLRERIDQLKQQMAGDCRPPGNMSKHRLGSVHVVWNEQARRATCAYSQSTVWSHTAGLEAYFGQLVAGCNGVARWPLFQNKYGQPEQLACFREINIQNVIFVMFWIFTVLNFLYQWAKFSLVVF